MRAWFSQVLPQLLRNGKVPERTCAHDPGSSDSELRSASCGIRREWRLIVSIVSFFLRTPFHVVARSRRIFTPIPSAVSVVDTANDLRWSS